MDIKLTPYREINACAHNIGGVPIPEEKKWPKKYPCMKRGKASFEGAGILPICLKPGTTDEFLLLGQRYLKGKKDPARWHDFGGKKKMIGEFPTHCASRHFAKKTYGLFGVHAPQFFESPTSTKEDIEELLFLPKKISHNMSHGPANLPLMVRSCEEWVKSEVDGEMVFYQSEQHYFLYVVFVPYLNPSFLDLASERVDQKRTFRWLECKDFCQEPLARRLHIGALIDEVSISFGDHFRHQIIGRNKENKATFTVKYLYAEDEKNDADGIHKTAAESGK